MKNAYIDTSVQKGGIPGVAGCLEHTGVVTQLIREHCKKWLILLSIFVLFLVKISKNSLPHWQIILLVLSKMHLI